MDAKKIFETMDKNHDGKITLAELTAGVEEFGIPVRGDKIKAIFEKNDANKNGTLDLPEFQAAMADMMASNPKAAALMKAFKDMDKDANGTLDLKELTQAMKQVGADVDAAEMFKKIDVNGDGKITIKEFMAFSLK